MGSNFGLCPDPAESVAAAFRAGQRIATLAPALESSLVWILAMTLRGQRPSEDALIDFPGCAVVILHDRWFLDRIATHNQPLDG